MARLILNGNPGEVYTNPGPKVQYQLIVSFRNSCGLCCQYHHAIGPLFPTPFHRGCLCVNRLIGPGEKAQPYEDFREKIRELDHVQQGRVMGKANLQLVEAGIVGYDDVVTRTRIRDLREVVSRQKLGVDRMVGAGVDRRVAERAYQTVNTPAHVLKDQQRKAILSQLSAKGVSANQLREAVGSRLAMRVGIDVGPSGPSYLNVAVVTPKPPKPKPKRERAVAKVKPGPTAGPTGKPVGEALDIPNNAFGDRIKPIVKAIEKVHGDGNLKRIPVNAILNPSLGTPVGYYDHTGVNGPQGVFLRSDYIRAELTFVHEIGHFIELTAIPKHVVMGNGLRDWANDSLMEEWSKAVAASKATRALERITIGREIAPGLPVNDENIEYKNYLLSPIEQWARSYSQYVATRSGHPVLRKQLETERSFDSVWDNHLWSDEDFEPIATAIDTIMRRLGWMK